MKNRNTRVSPQSKLIHVNDGFGNSQIAKMQGSTVEIYDSVDLPVAGGDNVSLDFFIDSKTRSFPFTNLKDGKLPPQESFIMERIRFGLITETISTGDKILLPLYKNNGSRQLPAMGLGEFSFQIANQRVLKPLSLSVTAPPNNNGQNDFNNVFNFDTMLAITPQLEFTLQVKIDRVPAAAVDTKHYIVAYIGGPGALFAPKQNY